MLLYRDASYSSPLPNDRILSFSSELGPGRSIEEPLALKLLPAEAERRFTVTLVAKYAGELAWMSLMWCANSWSGSDLVRP